jgi:hypothetical protein
MMVKIKQLFHNPPFLVFFFLLFCNAASLRGQADSLVFEGNRNIVGEIQKMQQGVLEIDVPYDDENFKIKWLAVREIYTGNEFVIKLNDKVYSGKIISESENQVKIVEEDSVHVVAHLKDIVYFTPNKEGFKNRFDAAVELGLNLTKAQDLNQFSLRSALGYSTDRWSVDVSYNLIRSSQSNVDNIKRSDGLLNYNYLIFKDWYLNASITSLSNTEQRIRIRANTQLGVGKYLFNTNRAYWGINIGVNNNLEKFETEPNTKNTWELALGTELNLFDIKDFELNLLFLGYSGLTDPSRYRTDITFDLKYELPLDFFVRTGISFNYDNRPAENAASTDYIIRTGFGWEW